MCHLDLGSGQRLKWPSGSFFPGVALVDKTHSPNSPADPEDLGSPWVAGFPFLPAHQSNNPITSSCRNRNRRPLAPGWSCWSQCDLCVALHGNQKMAPKWPPSSAIRRHADRGWYTMVLLSLFSAKERGSRRRTFENELHSFPCLLHPSFSMVFCSLLFPSGKRKKQNFEVHLCADLWDW